MLLELMFKGGPIMVPLLIFSILALAVIFDRSRAFWTHAKTDFVGRQV